MNWLRKGLWRFSPRRFGKWLDLPASEHRGLLEAMLLLAGIRLALWLRPFDAIRQELDRPARRSRRSRSGANEPAANEIMRVRRHVDVGSRYIPGASCLTQALAAQVLLRRAGLDTMLRIGVKKEPVEGFKAHAWLECDGVIVVGGEVMPQFTPLPPIG
jgi:hypothetical protein